ncbi:transposase DDE domain protein [Orientia tsutsugamushi str. UT144]|uniref:Transposase DDE domain protein n=1 Tax=Orientia tsutsugamushi str. UT144 TaxID=1441384 RepID=A0A0F3RK55_ORITS|nr:transposase DDE domain protein [Orientia tsutsugamushi str. UT144]
MRAINKWLLIKTIFNISHNHNCTLSLVCLLHYAFHTFLILIWRLFTNLRKDIKRYLLDIQDKWLLNKRSLIDSVFNVLKKHMLLEHTRHRSPLNFFVHIICFSC